MSHLLVTVVDKSESVSLNDVAMNVYMRIFGLFKNVTHLDLTIKDAYRYPSLSLVNLPSTACFSSTIVRLSIGVMSFEDFLSLLDGRLNQLQTFNVEIYNICPSTNRLEDTVNLI